MANLNQAQVRGLQNLDELRRVVGLLGFDAQSEPHDPSEELPETIDAEILQHGQRRTRGYAVMLADLQTHPRSFQKLGRHLIVDIHDRPLAFCGIRNEEGNWSELVVLRPRWVVEEREERRNEVLTVARLTVDLESPTSHDLYVLNELAWRSEDDVDHGKAAQERIDAAFDTEEVTKRFFSGLRTHHDRILASVQSASEDEAVYNGVEQAGGTERVALRLLTQVLFCYFLQRKGLFENDGHWLANQSQRAHRQGQSVYQSVLEPLFYDVLANPRDRRPEDWQATDIPFLNGGLFERLYGGISLPIPNEVIDHNNGLISFLDGWTFTISEEAPGEPEVAVDPEMLGKVFESLVSDEEKERHGVVYTPRPVVRFMCREALVPQLERKMGITEELARSLLIDDHAGEEIVSRYSDDEARALFEKLDRVSAELTVLDPAVGSGAFLLGMLAEILRLRRMAYPYLSGGEEADQETQRNWKFEAIRNSLFGVDIQPGAVEICMLRLWLALIVDEPGEPDPLPNLEHRIICADSLLDFVNGVQVQFTQQSGMADLGYNRAELEHLTELRKDYFATAEPDAKRRLREAIHTEEDRVINDILDRAKRAADEDRERAEIEQLAEEFASHDRRMPVFMPAFTNPQVWENGGWDIVVLNPPYLSRSKFRRTFSERYMADLEWQYGRTMDLLAHFSIRAFDYVHSGGTVAVIANDSWFTSIDARDMRLTLFSTNRRIRALARTKCFEGVAVNGGIFVAEQCMVRPTDDIRWIENYRQDPEEMLGASIPAAARRQAYPVQNSELWVVPLSEYRRLPHRPAFRPSPEARELLRRYEDCVAWKNEFSMLYSGQKRSRHGWGLLAQTNNLRKRQEEYISSEWYDSLRTGQFILSGLVIQGGVGLQTGDDRQFLAALDGTSEAEEIRRRQAEYLEKASEHPGPAARIQELSSQGLDDESVLVTLNQEYERRDLGWPRSGLIRIVAPDQVHHQKLTENAREHGLDGPIHWLPFEKGDRSTEEGGTKWIRENPFVIDWSTDAVELLHQRARHGPRKPYFRNKHAWGRAGATWNRVARYMRARRVPEGGIFSDMAPTIVPLEDCEWLTANVLLALLNSSVVDFLLRTFVGSLMHIEVGDVRAIPLPVLDSETTHQLDELVEEAVVAKLTRDEATDEATRQEADEQLRNAEQRIDEIVLELYGLDANADLWVVR